MKEPLKFVGFLLSIFLLIAGLIRYEAYTNPPPGRYELSIADDGEVSVFDNATGEAWQIRAGTGDQYFAPRGEYGPVSPPPLVAPNKKQVIEL